MSGQRLTPANRVRRRPEFERAYATGLRVRGHYMTVFLVPNGLVSARLGVAATRKLGPAVERNRAKRLAREIFRRHKVSAGLDIVIVPRREMLNAPFNDLEAEYLAAVDRQDRPRERTPTARHGDLRRPRRNSRV